MIVFSLFFQQSALTKYMYNAYQRIILINTFRELILDETLVYIYSKLQTIFINNTLITYYKIVTKLLRRYNCADIFFVTFFFMDTSNVL